MGKEAAFDLNLVLEELFVNSVRHGGCEGMDNSARIKLRNGTRVEVEFWDRGKPFDTAHAPEPDPAAPAEERSAAGLGIHLVRQILHEVEYRRAGGWNQVSGKLGAA